MLWVEDADIRIATGDVVRVGDHQLDSGLANLQLGNGVDVVIQALSRFRIASATLLLLPGGRLSARVSPAGKGFTVYTPSAEVIDHGTEFGVEVTAGIGSEVHVFQGEVEVKSRVEASESVRLFGDQAMRIDELVGSAAGITVAPERYLRSFEEPDVDYARQIRALKPLLYFRMAPGEELIDRSSQLPARLVSGSQKTPLFAPGHIGSSFRLEGPRTRAHASVADYPKAADNQPSVVAWVRAGVCAS